MNLVLYGTPLNIDLESVVICANPVRQDKPGRSSALQSGHPANCSFSR